MEPFLGMISLMGFNFAPRGWAFCQGQLLPLSQNTALFALLGTMYGGNGQTTFALPDLRGRAPIGWGQAPGLSSYNIGDTGGVESVSLVVTQMPMHTHPGTGLNATFGASTSTATESIPGTNGANALGVAASGGRPLALYVNATPNVALQGGAVTGAVAPAGGSQPHENRPPYLAMNYVIALQGIFPSRD